MESYKREYDKIVRNLDKIRGNISKLKEHAKDKISHANTSYEKRKIMDSYKKNMFDMKYDKNLKEKFSTLRKRKRELENLMNDSQSQYKNNTTESKGTKINNIMNNYQPHYKNSTTESNGTKINNIMNNYQDPFASNLNKKMSNNVQSFGIKSTKTSNIINKITDRNCDTDTDSSYDLGGSSDYEQFSSDNVCNTNTNTNTNSVCTTGTVGTANICRIKLSSSEQKALKAYYKYLLKLKGELEK